MNQTKIRTIAIVTAILSFQQAAHADVASAFVREGDITSRGVIDSVSNTAVNHIGGYAATATVDAGDRDISTIYGNAFGGNVDTLREEATIGDNVQNSFEGFFGLDDSGQLSYSASLDRISTGETGLDSVWTDDSPVQTEGDTITATPEFSTFNSRPGITADGKPYWVGGLTDSVGGLTLERALILDGNILLRAGDSIGVPEPISLGSGIDFDFRFSRLGTNYISPIDVDAAATEDIVIALNGTALAAGGTILREDNLVPVSVGGNGTENWDNFDFVDVNEAGDYFVTGDTNGATSADEFVLLNGEFVLREGDTVSGFTLNGGIEGGVMNENGDWAVIWDIDSGADNLEALIINGEVALVEGDPVDWNNDGQIDDGDSGYLVDSFTGISSLTLSDRDVSGNFTALFTADVDNGGDLLEGAFQYTAAVPEPCSGILLQLALITAFAFWRRRR